MDRLKAIHWIVFLTFLMVAIDTIIIVGRFLESLTR